MDKALELADELERPNNWQQENNFTTRAATMLRQQQAEIEALKKELETCKTIVALSNIAWERKHGKD